MGESLAVGDWSAWSLLSCRRLSMVKADLRLAPESGVVLTGDGGNTEEEGVKGGDSGAMGTLVTGRENGGLGGRYGDMMGGEGRKEVGGGRIGGGRTGGGF